MLLKTLVDLDSTVIPRHYELVVDYDELLRSLPLLFLFFLLVVLKVTEVVLVFEVFLFEDAADVMCSLESY